jgi:hypothetical protein
MTGAGYRRGLLAVAAGCLAMIAVASADAAQMVSHQALYSMSLQSSIRASDVAHLDGRMAIEIVDACDGWTIEQRVVLTITTFDGDEIASYTSFTSWESDDGQRFRFEQQTRQGNVVIDELGGDARLNGGEGGVAKLSKPEAMNIALPPGTVFPNIHTELLIANAEAGETFFNRLVFDGTSVDNPNHVTAFIGNQTAGPQLPMDTKAPMVWPVRLAFFQLDTQNPEPDVEIGLLLEANGVTRAIELDYGSFVIDGRLDELELLAPIDC